MDIAARLIACFCLLVSSVGAFAFDDIPRQQGEIFSSDCNGTTVKGVGFGGWVSACTPKINGTTTSNGGACGTATNTKVWTATLRSRGSSSFIYDYTLTTSTSYSLAGCAPSSTTQTGAGSGFIDFTYYCGDGATASGTGSSMICSCPSGWMPKPDKLSCYQYTCPPSGSYSSITQPDQLVTNAGDALCSGGCGLQPSSWKVGADGRIWATWPFKSTGRFCAGDPKPSTNVDSGEQNTKNPAPVACGQNQCPGNVNGATVCVPCQKTTEQGPSTSASAPTGGASAPGSSTTTTECNGITCTTTTTTKDGSGNSTGSTSTTQKQESFCQQNPESSLCKQSSFSGACAATTCQGDAIQCAIAADQFRRNCQFFDDPEAVPLKQAGLDAMNGQSQPDGHPAKSPDAVPVSFSSAIDQTDAIGGGNCPADVSVPLTVPLVGVQQLSIPLSHLCDPLQMVGRVLVAISLLWAGVFVFKGVS